MRVKFEATRIPPASCTSAADEPRLLALRRGPLRRAPAEQLSGPRASRLSSTVVTPGPTRSFEFWIFNQVSNIDCTDDRENEPRAHQRGLCCYLIPRRGRAPVYSQRRADSVTRNQTALRAKVLRSRCPHLFTAGTRSGNAVSSSRIRLSPGSHLRAAQHQRGQSALVEGASRNAGRPRAN